jgi:peptidoglycan glycosyltransferase
MDKPVRRLFLLFCVLFIALVVQLTYVQVLAAPDLKVEPSNTRAIQEELQVDRGEIYSADGVLLADNREVNGYFYRQYHQGDLTAPWLGYNSQQYGRAGIERVYNEDLSGQSGILGLTSEVDRALGRTHHGADLQLTIDMDVQKVAAEALGRRKGAVVALDPRTGAVLAMVSYPRYDPNKLEEMWEAIVSDEDTPLLNRVSQGLYPPGSVFKVIVAAAALERGVVTPGTKFEDTGTFRAGGYVVSNYGDRIFGEHDFTRAFSSSINTTFAKLGVELGADAVADYAYAFGFGQESVWDMGWEESRFPDPGDMDDAHVAQASFGQGEVLASPLEMALVTSAVANGGKIMKPYIVSTVVDGLESEDPSIIREASPAVWLEPVSSQTAATMTALMVEVVRSGTGTAAALGGVQVAGKTGTAEVAEAETHAWFAGFAPAEDPRVAVAVLVENAGTGGGVAAPIARKVISAVLGR